jgi:glycolate oxidase FAD binding subunit
MLRPTTLEEAAEALRELTAGGGTVRPRGAGTKAGWGGADPQDAVDLDTRSLDRIVEHNAGDFTAILEAGVPFAAAQAQFAEAGQMLALDPPLGSDDAATVGGVIASADSGPLRHRYGGVRDLVLGMTVVLADGSVARTGGKVIKNVAGYDIAKLFSGSFGTLGLIGSVSVRLHPLAPLRVTVRAVSSDADRLAAAALELAALPLEAEAMDVAWAGGEGQLLLRFAGTAAQTRAVDVAQRLSALGEAEVVEDDTALWAAQRARQRAVDGGLVVKVAALATDLARVLRVADAHDATVVGRAAHGLSWLALPSANSVTAVREGLAPRGCTVLDGAALVTDPWPSVDPGVRALMDRLKARFDPARAFRPGTYVGGI